MTEQAMLKEMFQGELSQADCKAIGRSRGFDAETVASGQLLQHVFLSEQGVAEALASLTETERLGLHLLHALQDEAELEFFRKLYPDRVAKDSYYGSYTARFKPLFQQVNTQLVRRGLLLFGTLPEGQVDGAVLERRRFRFPEVFAALLPAPFKPSRLEGAAPQYRSEVLRQKVLEIPREAATTAVGSARAEGRWLLANGELLFGGQPFRVERLQAWRSAQLDAAVGYTNKTLPKAFLPVPLLQYALGRLGAEEWLDPRELAPFWDLALPGVKAPEPPKVCEAGYDWGWLEKAEQGGASYYRLPQRADTEAASPPETYLDAADPQRARLRLEHTPLKALEQLCEISRLDVAEDTLWAEPHLLKLSHAPPETLADPMVGWLRERHPAFRNALATLEQRWGKLIVHDNLLVARVSDLGLKVMLEKKFGGPGRLAALAGEFIAFPLGLLPEVQAWMKKSGHVIKNAKEGK